MRDELLKRLRQLIETETLLCLTNGCDSSEILTQISAGIDRGALTFQKLRVAAIMKATKTKGNAHVA